MRFLITGGEQGLGQAIKEVLERKGHEAANFPGFLLRAAYNYPQRKTALEQTLDSTIFPMGLPRDPIDIVINNFGINHLSWIGETPADDEEIMWINSMAPYWIVNWLYRRQGSRPVRVLNIASQTYRVNQRCTAIYGASKAALVSLTKNMARELAPSGWIINCLAPGKILGTEMTRLTDAQVLALRGWSVEDADEYARKMIPAGRFTNVLEVADAAVRLLDMPPYVNGAVLDVMGGV
jgi:3-oxoacyl-[acyl-carrier protein] reductase